MKVLVFDTADLAVARTAQQIIDQVNTKPACVLGLATGGTMPPVYAQLARAFDAGKVSFGQSTTFNLDEYVGLPSNHACSYHEFMKQELFSKTDFQSANTHLPNGDAVDPVAESSRYEKLIEQHGPIDLQLLGIGTNGHIGFNEPTSSLASRTRIKTLTAATRSANKRYFGAGEEPPFYAITVGIQTILESSNIVLLATGANKAQAVAGMVEGPLGAHNPATALQLHPNATVILDQSAAAELKLKEYYFQVHPNGKEVRFG